MHPILRNTLATITGIILGSVANMSLVNLGHSIFPMEGVDPNDMEALTEAMSTASAKYFLFPFLAHAIGTLVGAFVAAALAVNHKLKFALGIGGFFLLGGITVSFLIPAPMWFISTDIILAYIPMAYIGGKIALSLSKS